MSKQSNNISFTRSDYQFTGTLSDDFTLIASNSGQKYTKIFKKNNKQTTQPESSLTPAAVAQLFANLSIGAEGHSLKIERLPADKQIKLVINVNLLYLTKQYFTFTLEIEDTGWDVIKKHASLNVKRAWGDEQEDGQEEVNEKERDTHDARKEGEVDGSGDGSGNATTDGWGDTGGGDRGWGDTGGGDRGWGDTGGGDRGGRRGGEGVSDRGGRRGRGDRGGRRGGEGVSDRGGRRGGGDRVEGGGDRGGRRGSGDDRGGDRGGRRGRGGGGDRGGARRGGDRGDTRRGGDRSARRDGTDEKEKESQKEEIILTLCTDTDDPEEFQEIINNYIEENKLCEYVSLDYPENLIFNVTLHTQEECQIWKSVFEEHHT